MDTEGFIGIREAAGMAAASYTFDAETLLARGWRDACAQLGPTVACGLNPGADEKTRDDFHAVLKALDHRRSLRRNITSSVRQLRSGSGVKSMTLVRPGPDGRLLFCVVIMGSVQLDDWLANFDMVSENGMHRGFLRRALTFEELEPDLTFPQTAKELGLDRLSLRDVIERCRLPGSPYRICVTGHSLGAAVMQVYVHHLLTVRGVAKENLLGVGFAPPSVATADAVARPEDWPIRHIINTDDVIPRTGAQVHLGQCLSFEPDMAMRTACYRYPDTDEAIDARREMRPVFDGLTDTGSCLCFGLALLELIADLPPKTVLPFLGRLKRTWAPLQLVIEAGDSQADRFNRHLQRRAASAYRSLLGERPDSTLIARFYHQLRTAVDRIGLQPAITAVGQLAAAPHSMGDVYTRIADRIEEEEG
ncbi:MAG: hypothetical protein IKP10_00600 [Clostridia bacterium]|nr:hypothetical protein [Clostridia bacterium]